LICNFIKFYLSSCFLKFISSLSEALKIVKKDKTPFLTEEEEEELKKTQQIEIKQIETLPFELSCPFQEHGKHLIRDAVLVPCCGHFICCDECIREKILLDEIVECPIKGCGHEIDSLESITPHHQMRKMVNDYLTDINLNKINKLEKLTSKTDEAFIDLLLNDEFIHTAAAATTTTIINKSESLTAEGKISQFNAENEIYKDFIEISSTNKRPLSPVQDSKISSTLSLSSFTQDVINTVVVTTAGMKKIETLESSETSRSVEQPIPALQYVVFFWYFFLIFFFDFLVQLIFHTGINILIKQNHIKHLI
jgi:hypothetical protein